MPFPHWAPAEQTVPEWLHDIMYMSVQTFDDGRVIHQYKRCDTRRYLNLDDSGQAWQLAVDPATGEVGARRLDLVQAQAQALALDRPIAPEWAEMLHLGRHAAQTIGDDTTIVLEEHLDCPRIRDGHRRPLVFDHAFMRHWLDREEARACQALRTAGGYTRFPDCRAEADEFIGGTGCLDHGSGHWIRYPLASDRDEQGLWEATVCFDCSRPFLRLWRGEEAPALCWSYYNDLR